MFYLHLKFHLNYLHTSEKIRETKVKYAHKNCIPHLRTCIFNFIFTATCLYHVCTCSEVEDVSESTLLLKPNVTS